MKNYYEILNVSRGTTKRKIMESYQLLISKYDINNYSGEAKKLVEQQIKDINEAYSVLSDDLLRKKYDAELDKSNEKDSQFVEEEPVVKDFSQSESVLNKFRKNKRNKQESKNVNKVNKQTKDQDKLETDVYDMKKVKKEKRNVGTFDSMTNLTRMVFENLPKIHFDTSKESIFALIGAIALVALLCIILWFIPFTHDFIKNFLLFK